MNAEDNNRQIAGMTEGIMPEGSEEERAGHGGVRTLERALHIVDALAESGWSGPTELSRRTGIDRATVYRLLSTLVAADYVVRRRQDGRYFLSAKLRHLGGCVRDEDIRMVTAGPALAQLVDEIHWPSDFAILSSGLLTIVESNYARSTLTLFRSVLGQTRPLLRSALGRALLAFMSPEQFEATIETVSGLGGSDAADLADYNNVMRIVRTTRERGYAVAVAEAAETIAAIALPVRQGSAIVGAVNVVMFVSRFDEEKAAASYLPPLRRCIANIERAISSSGGCHATYKGISKTAAG